MLDTIKHITDDNFFFQEDSTQVHCVCNTIQYNPIEWKMWFSCFPILTGSAEPQVIWGGIVKRLLIAYFIGNISAKKYQNPFTCIKVIARQRWDVFFETWCIYVDVAYCYRQSSEVCLSVCHDYESCKYHWTDRDVIWDADSGGSKEACIRWRCTLA